MQAIQAKFFIENSLSAAQRARVCGQVNCVQSMNSRGQSGLTLIEVLVAVCIVAVMAAKFLDELLIYQERAEKTAFETVVGAMRSGLQMEMARVLLQKGRGSMGELVDINPMNTLMDSPPNYGGLLDTGQEPERGKWYFEAGRRELVYRPQIDNNLSVSKTTNKELRFRVEVLGLGDSSQLNGIRLTAVTPFRWF